MSHEIETHFIFTDINHVIKSSHFRFRWRHYFRFRRRHHFRFRWGEFDFRFRWFDIRSWSCFSWRHRASFWLAEKNTRFWLVDPWSRDFYLFSDWSIEAIDNSGQSRGSSSISIDDVIGWTWTDWINDVITGCWLVIDDVIIFFSFFDDVIVIHSSDLSNSEWSNSNSASDWSVSISTISNF